MGLRVIFVTYKIALKIEETCNSLLRKKNTKDKP